MTELVFQGQNNQALTNSLLVAEKFGKNHSDVVRAVDNLLEKANSSDFQCDAKMDVHKMFYSYAEDVPQPNGGLKPAKRYVMNRDGFTLLTMGFTGKKALKFKLEYIAAFNAMETVLKEQQKPLSAVQMFALQANINLEHEQRLSNVEQKLEALAREREENTTQLLSVSVSVENVPEMSLRDKIRQLINKYSSVTNINQRDVWHKVYELLYYRYHISINSYTKRDKRETNLDVAERNGLLDKIYTIISSMIRDSKQIA